jgi:DNA-binding GntR family transcriptional regulator
LQNAACAYLQALTISPFFSYTLTSLSREVAARSLRPCSRIPSLEAIEADKNIASRLHLSPGRKFLIKTY